MKKLLVLGGGKNQVPIIKSAKAEGYYVVLCDCYNDSPGIALSDKFYQISTIEREAVLQIAISEKVNGVIGNTEAIMTNIAFITQKLNLIGNKEESVRKLISKSEFREIQHNLGMFAPKCYETDNFKNAIDKLKDFQFPIIVKPGENSGSRGTTIINDISDIENIEKVFNYCKEISRNKKVIFEEFVEMSTMDEIEAEIFVNNGEILWDGLLLTLRDKDIPLIPTTDIYPLPYSKDKIDRIKNDIQKLIDAVGFVHGECNAELYFTPKDELFVMEINARQGGDAIPQYVYESTGVDMYKLLVTTAVNDNYYWEELKTFKRNIKYVVHHPIFSKKTGVFEELFIDDCIKKYIKKIYLSKEVGNTVPSATNATDEIGYCDLVFPTQNEQLNVVSNIEKYIKVIVK